MNVKLTKTQRILVESPQDIARIMQQILLRENRVSRMREHFWTAGLSHKFNLLYVELVSLGTKTHTPVEPMEVFKLALQKDASYLFLCHNHGGGDFKPLQSDKNITDRLIQVGRIVGIQVYDHIVIAPKTEEYLSFRDTGVMQKLEQSTSWVPPYKLMKEIKKMAIAEGARKRDIEIAKALKKKKIPVDIIANATGLTQAEIEKL